MHVSKAAGRRCVNWRRGTAARRRRASRRSGRRATVRAPRPFARVDGVGPRGTPSPRPPLRVTSRCLHTHAVAATAARVPSRRRRERKAPSTRYRRERNVAATRLLTQARPGATARAGCPSSTSRESVGKASEPRCAAVERSCEARRAIFERNNYELMAVER